jgi:hypothetical protein
MEPIQVRFFLDWKEYYAAQQFLKRQLYGIAIERCIGVALLLLATLLGYVGGYPLWYPLGAALIGLWLLAGLPWMHRFELKQKWMRERLHRAEHLVSFDEEGISYIQGHVRSQYGWRYYQRLLESPEGFLLIYGGDIFSFIPKRAFASEQLLNEFRALLRAKLAS